MSKNLIVTSYFCNKPDVRNNTSAARNDVGYIGGWYDSVKALDLDAIILHDGLSSEFILEYQTDKISFRYHDTSRWSLNDERFLALETLLSEVDCDKILMTDGSDVVINKDPFDFINDPDLLYFGTDRPDTPLVKDNIFAFLSWIKLHRLLKLSRESLDHFLTFNYVNAGIFGGYAAPAAAFLIQLNQLFRQINSDTNNNMMAVNYVLWANNVRHWKGQPFTSPFKNEDTSSQYYIKHK